MCDSGKIISGQWIEQEFRGSCWRWQPPGEKLTLASACVAENKSPQLCDRVKARDINGERRPAGIAVATVCEREVVGVLVIYTVTVSSH